MRKADLISNVSEKTGIPKVDIIVAIEAFIKEIKNNMIEGEPVYIRGFGSFILKRKAAKIGRNIKKNEAIKLEAQIVPAFKPAKEFVNEVKKNVSPDKLKEVEEEED